MHLPSQSPREIHVDDDRRLIVEVLQKDRKATAVNAIFPLLAGFATFFLGGTAFARFTGSLGKIKFVFTGFAGVAVFVFVFIHPIFKNEIQDPTHGIGIHSLSGDRVKFNVSGSFDLGYSISPGSWVVVDTRTGTQIAANITVVGPDARKDAFSNQAVYQTSTTWGWQRQGSAGGSLDFTDQDPFVRYPGGVLSHSAYNNPTLRAPHYLKRYYSYTCPKPRQFPIKEFLVKSRASSDAFRLSS